MKTILGLDLGPNSIGWAKVEVDDKGNYLRNIKLGSRIIPMDQGILGKFDSGVTESQTCLLYTSHKNIIINFEFVIIFLKEFNYLFYYHKICFLFCFYFFMLYA